MWGPLLALLLSVPCDSAAVSRLPAEKREAACTLLSTEPPERVAASSDLAAIYERPGFERARQRETGALAALLARIGAWFESMFESTEAETYSNTTRVLVLIAALAVAALSLWRIWRRSRRPAVTPVDPAHPVPLQLDPPVEHLGRAEAMLEREPRAALRESLLGLLSHLEQRRYARPDRVKTNRELTEELASRGAPTTLVEAVRPLFARYDTTFYALVDVEPRAARDFLDEVRRLVAAS